MEEILSPVAIVTGGAQGIGAAICVALLKEGYRICIADIQEEKGKQFMTNQQHDFGKERVMFSVCDVSKDEEFEATFELTLKTFKRIDVLVNNAGIVREKNPKEVIAVNLMGVMTGCQLALQYMGKSKGGNGGVVINTASIAGFVPLKNYPAYVASKHGIIGWTRCYGHPNHLEEEGMTFAAICPSSTGTEIGKKEKFDPVSKDSRKLKLMTPEFVAGGVLKILQERINGSILVITKDNGYQYMEIPKDYEFMMDELAWLNK